MTEDFDDYDDGENVICPRCTGLASIGCYCGGDLCVCNNYGEMDCPYCYGEGSVTPKRHDDYLERQRKAYAEFHRPLEEGGAA